MSSADTNSGSYADLARGAIAFLRRNKREVAISLGLGLVAALLAAHFAPLKYRAEVMVSSQEGMSTSANLANLSDLAGLAGGAGGLGEGGSAFQPFLRFTQTLTNNSVADELVKQPWVMPTVFSKSWDPETNSWHPPRGFIGGLMNLARTIAGVRAWHAPGPDELQKILARNVTVVKFGRYPAYTISLEWPDPEVGRRLLQLLLTTNDAIIQSDAQTRLTRTTTYLEQRLNNETQLDRRNALNQLLLEQERQLMAAETKGPYAAKIIDRMAVSTVFRMKIEYGAGTLILALLLCFYGFVVIRRMRSGASLLAAVRAARYRDQQFGLPHKNPS